MLSRLLNQNPQIAQMLFAPQGQRAQPTTGGQPVTGEVGMFGELFNNNPQVVQRMQNEEHQQPPLQGRNMLTDLMASPTGQQVTQPYVGNPMQGGGQQSPYIGNPMSGAEMASIYARNKLGF